VGPAPAAFRMIVIPKRMTIIPTCMTTIRSREIFGITVRLRRIAVIPNPYACNTATVIQQYLNTRTHYPGIMKDIITIRGERELWLDFIHKAKKEKKKAWEVLIPFLRKYLATDEDNRVMLILFPKDLVEQLLEKEDPDQFIEEAIKKNLIRDR